MTEKKTVTSRRGMLKGAAVATGAMAVPMVATAQTTTLRWEDYTQTAMDPVDDCTVWYVGDYLKAGAASYSTRIGAVQVPGCAAR